MQMGKKQKLITLHIVFILILTLLPERTSAIANVSARNAILIEQESGRILFAKAEHEQRRIASITKIMTAILAIESGKMEETVRVSKNAEGTEGSSLYLKAGQKIKLEDLVYGLMLRSGNDAAVAIAEHVGGSLEGFVFLMNQRAKMIGMTNTVFANPHGLDDHENHYSTAYDMAILTQYAMKSEDYKEVAGTKIHRAPNSEENWDYVWKNKNKLLTQLYEYCTGGKTGYTKRAKRTLVSTASKDGVDLIAVTLNGPDDWNDHAAMFNYGFEHYDLTKVVEKGKIKNITHDFYENNIYIKRDFLYPLTKEEKQNLKTEVKLMEPKSSWQDESNIPLHVGKMYIYLGANKIGILPVYYKEGIILTEDSWFTIIEQFFLKMLGVSIDG